MATPDEARAELFAAADELESAVDSLRMLARARGQGDPSVPLVVLSSDTELLAAVDRELIAHERVRKALEEMYGPRR